MQVHGGAGSNLVVAAHFFGGPMKWKTTDRLNNITPKNQVPVSEHIVWVEMGWSKGHLADRKKPVLKRWIQYAPPTWNKHLR